MKKKIRIFVAGHTGLIGSAVFRKLKQLNYKNIVVATKKELNLLDQSKVFDFLKKKKKLNQLLCVQLGWVALKQITILRVVSFMKT